jgi:hypothetical protein
MVLYIDGSRSRYAETDVLPPKKKKDRHTRLCRWPGSSIGGSPGGGSCGGGDESDYDCLGGHIELKVIERIISIAFLAGDILSQSKRMALVLSKLQSSPEFSISVAR